MEDINCPFCKQEGFDLIGLKHHFMMGYCYAYNSTISVEEEREQRQQKDGVKCAFAKIENCTTDRKETRAVEKGSI